MKKSFLKVCLIAFAVALSIVSCKEDEVPNPMADFTFTVDASMEVTFTNTSTDAIGYSWNFGDGSAVSTEMSPKYKYLAGGSYEVTLTAVGEEGTLPSEKKQTVVVTEPGGKNYILGGNFETADASSWTVLTTGQKDADGTPTNVKYAFGYTAYKPAMGTGGALFVFPTNDGIAKPFEEGTIFYQNLGALDAGDYKITFVIKHGGDSPDVAGDMQNEWFEFVLNAAQPVVNDGYNFARITGWIFSGWTGVSIPANDGLMPYAIMNTNLANADGKFNIATAGTYYLGIKVGKGGASTFGEGIAIDNLKIQKAQ